MKKIPFIILTLMLVIAGCSEDTVQLPEITAVIDGVPWKAKGFETSTTSINNFKTLQTLTAYADDGTRIVISIGLLGLSSSKLTAGFRKRSATLDYFSGVLINPQTVLLKWQTSKEMNMNYFTVRRSYDGNNYSELNYVYGSGDSDTPRAYQFVSNDSFYSSAQKAFFQLSMKDYNGTETYSDVIEVKLQFEVRYQDITGQIFGGYDGKIELSEFKENRLSGTFNFSYRDSQSREVKVTTGVLKNVTF
jgi:hypothetical protein